MCAYHRPNIIIITCDQLRHDYIGPSNSIMRTPAIHRLAREGCLFENAYSPNPVCIPARQNMLTGLTARHHGFDDNYFGDQAKPAPYDLPTFPQILNDHRYETVAIGKLHFQPARRASGFDFFYNMDEVPHTREEDDYAMYLKEKGYGGIHGINGIRHCLYMQPQRPLMPEEHHGSAWVANTAIDYLKRTQRRRPFLMWAGFIHPHPPLHVPDVWANLYDNMLPPPSKSISPLPALAVENQQLACLEDQAALARMREMYAAAVSFADHHIGRILDCLDELNLTQNTLVLFTSDHGEMLGDLGTYQKFLPYDASCKVPFIIRWPERLESGTLRQDFVDLNDVLPTVLDAAGINYPSHYDLPGESVLETHGTKNRTLQYVEHQRGSKRWCSLRNQRYKYVHFYGDSPRMFDMMLDPHETTNLLDSPLDAEAKAHLRQLQTGLLRYETRYGLPGHVENGAFRQFPRYEPAPYYECNFPAFVEHLLPEERVMMNAVKDEILSAIRKEKTVKLRFNHTAEILRQAGFGEDWIEDLLRSAEAQGN